MENKKPTILVFCAHSDDQIFGPGATLAKYSREGKQIFTVIYAYGESGLPWLKPEVAVTVRVKEARKAERVIGGKGVIFFGLKEGKFGEHPKEIKSRIKQIIAAKMPIKIFTHSLDDPHPDHRVVYNSVIEAIDEMQYECDVYSFDVWNPFNLRKTEQPKLYEDVTDTFQMKIKALKVFRSQKIALFTLLWSVYVRAVVHGFHIHKRFAERFFKVR